MPIGVYTVMDGHGNPVGEESFRCAPGPIGWRYFAEISTSVPEPHRETVDLVVDSDWRPVRVRIDTGSHDLLVSASDDRLRGARDDEPLDLAWNDDVDYLSPCFNVATANRLGRTADVEVVFFEPVTIEPRTEPQRYELLGEGTVDTPVGTFTANQWRYTNLRTGFTRPVWIAGEVVVAYEGVFELNTYDPGARGPFPA